jgi:hypothetical protein
VTVSVICTLLNAFAGDTLSGAFRGVSAAKAALADNMLAKTATTAITPVVFHLVKPNIFPLPDSTAVDSAELKY